MPPKRKAAAAAETKAKRARGETDLKYGLSWKDYGELLKGIYPVMLLDSDSASSASKIAGFDIDSTLIKTKSGKKFATGAKDWTWLYDCVPQKLKDLDKDGYRVVFFTNQAGIEKLKVNPNELKTKVEAMISELGICVFVYVATGNTHFRKPSTCMWDLCVERMEGKKGKIDLKSSIYVGDAAGRAKDWQPGKPRDFSCSDRMFAANIGIEFKTPEEFFLGEKPAKFSWGSFDVKQFMKSASKPTASTTYHAKAQEMVLMVGPPACGKSTLTKSYFVPHGYESVNRDTLGTAAKCVKKAKEFLKSGKSVVVDNTNPSKAVRSDFIELAEDAGVPCRCFVLQTSWELANHLNFVRQNQTNGEVRRIPDVGYNVYKKNFEQPSMDEGFSEVKKIDFVPKFASSKDEALFMQWT